MSGWCRQEGSKFFGHANFPEFSHHAFTATRLVVLLRQDLANIENHSYGTASSQD